MAKVAPIEEANDIKIIAVLRSNIIPAKGQA